VNSDGLSSDSMPVELAREIARQGDVRLSALMNLATAADLRATTICGIFGAGSIGIAAAVLAVWASDHRSAALIVSGVILSIGLYAAAILAAIAGAPREFYIGGGSPDILREWSWIGHGWRNETEMLDATAVRYARSIASNSAILEMNTWRMKAALCVAVMSPVISIAAFFVVYCLLKIF
jgi:hypothetical protein